MALKANAFIDYFDGFRESIADLSHYQFMIDWGLRKPRIAPLGHSLRWKRWDTRISLGAAMP
jgi:hypothetical protein